MKYVLKYTLLLEASTPKKGTKKTPKRKNNNRVKNTGYKINLDFDVIYTKHMLIIYLKIIYLLFFSTKQNFVHDPLTTKQCRVFWILRIWTTLTLKKKFLKTTGCCIMLLFLRETFLGLCTIYKQTKKCTRCAFGIPVMPVLNQ